MEKLEKLIQQFNTETVHSSDYRIKRDGYTWMLSQGMTDEVVHNIGTVHFKALAHNVELKLFDVMS